MSALPTEADEVAAAMPIHDIRSFEDACAVVRAQMGPPEEIGFQVFDNTAAALLVRAATTRR